MRAEYIKYGDAAIPGIGDEEPPVAVDRQPAWLVQLAGTAAAAADIVLMDSLVKPSSKYTRIRLLPVSAMKMR